MKYPLLASIILSCLLLMFLIHRTRNKEAKIFQAFLDREQQANRTRRQPLDNLNYITIPFDNLPTEVMKDDEKTAEYMDILHDLSKDPIVNFTGITNTELKLQYGAPNIDLLSRYDASYTLLARTLDSWGKRLYENGYVKEARSVLEFALSTGTDIKTTYTLLAKIYRDEKEEEKVDTLIFRAEELNSLTKKPILKALKENEGTDL